MSRFVPAAEQDGVRVEPYVGVLEMPDAAGGLESWCVAGVGVARADVVVVGEAGPGRGARGVGDLQHRSEEHTSELQSRMRNSYDVFCYKKKTTMTPLSCNK